MPEPELLDLFIKFGLAAAIGFVIGLERSMDEYVESESGVRDFTIVALIGAISALVAMMFDNSWLIGFAFIGLLGLMFLYFWAEYQKDPEDTGVTTEASVIVTFFLGVLVMKGMYAISVALAIAMLALLSQKQSIGRFSGAIKRFELDAAVKFLVITFIVLPILPNSTTDNLFTYDIGKVSSFDAGTGAVAFVPGENQFFDPDSDLNIYSDDTFRGVLNVDSVTEDLVSGRLAADRMPDVTAGTELRAALAPMFMMHMLAALKPFKVWMIVVLVSFISFVGYILVKVIGPSAGIGLTGIIGGLASSTVTTLSFARRSKELPSWNRTFAVAILLASSVMFPRLLIQIGVFNQALMRNMAVPILVTGAAGILMAVFYYVRSGKQAETKQESEEVSFDNPFSLQSAITFGLVLASIMMVTRLAITYLGEAWLPVVAIVSGLTDADAIAFSISDAQRAGLVSLDWAAFNVVLGALSNTFMKLFLAYTLGDKGLFKHLLLSFSVMGAVGIVTMFLYYDLGSMT